MKEQQQTGLPDNHGSGPEGSKGTGSRDVRWTPGPWKAIWSERNKRTHTGEWIWTAPQPGFPGQNTNVWLGGRSGNPEANARLIAAAPELYEALDAIVEGGAMGGESHNIKFCGCFGCGVRRILAKARGEL